MIRIIDIGWVNSDEHLYWMNNSDNLPGIITFPTSFYFLNDL